jgi:single-strand DNA-binding protein
VGDLRLAVNRRYKSRDGQDRDETCFVNITVWGRQAETCAEYLSKGSPVLVEGRLKFDEWEKEGQKFNRLGVVASRVQFLGGPKNASYRDGGRPPPAASDTGRQGPPPEAPEQPPAGPPDDDNLPF